MKDEFLLPLGYVLLHIRKSVPYTQAEISKLCHVSIYRYRLFEKNKATPTKQEWNCLCTIYQQIGRDLNQLHKITYTS